MLKNLLLIICSFSAFGIFAQENSPDTTHSKKRMFYKFDLTSMVFGEINFSLERQLGKKSSFEIEAGPTLSNIHLDKYLYNSNPQRKSQFGFFSSLAFRYYPLKRGSYLEHLYIAPKIKYRRFNEDVYTYAAPTSFRGYQNNTILTLNLGVQQGFFSRYVLDFYLGAGVEYSKQTTYYNFQNKPLYGESKMIALQLTDRSYSLHFTGGVKIGIGNTNRFIPEKAPKKKRKSNPVDYKNIYKLDPAQAVFGELSFSYERVLRNNLSLEAELGPEWRDFTNSDFDAGGNFTSHAPKLGFFGSAAVRFYMPREKFAPNQLYLSPKLKFRRYNEGVKGHFSKFKDGFRNETLATMNIGYQLWFNHFSIDFYAGAGIGFYHIVTYYDPYDASANPLYMPYNGLTAIRSNDVKLAVSFGIKFGLAH